MNSETKNNENTTPTFYKIIKLLLEIIYDHFAIYIFFIILNFITINIYPLMCGKFQFMDFLYLHG